MSLTSDKQLGQKDCLMTKKCLNLIRLEVFLNLKNNLNVKNC
jgi:hypothetical protein